MKKYTALTIIALGLTFTGCSTCPTDCKTSCCQPVVIEKLPSTPRGPIKPNRIPQQPSGVVGVWSGSSYGETINVKFGSNGSIILNNAAGSNSGSWSSQGSGRFSVNIAGQSGSMVLLNSSTASLNIGGSTIELSK